MSQAAKFIRSRRDEIIRELSQFLAIPSISSDPEYKSEVVRCADWTAEMLKRAGMESVAVYPTGGHPVVYGEWLKADDQPTILIYGHYDVQPVDPLDLWERPPFQAHIKDDLLVARGSADDKGQVYMHIKAVEALINTEGALPINIKFIIEGEEEVASPHLAEFTRTHRDLLTADIIVISDTSMWAAGQPSITYGLRGLAYLEIELTGPNRDLHSGEYGGAVANPAEMLARLLAKVKDENGRIQIPGFYDDVLPTSEFERELLARVPFKFDDYKRELGVNELWGESPFSPLERSWFRPTFEINGMWSGFTGVGAKTVLPAKAVAKISCRLVPNQDPNKIATQVERFLIDNAPPSVSIKVIRHSGGHPFIAPFESPFMKAAIQALTEAFGAKPLLIRAGGSIPIVADFKNILGVDSLLVGFALPNCRAHSPNENLHLPSFFTGMEALVRFYQLVAK